MIVQIRPETSNDYDSIRHVNKLAFGGSMEATLVDEVRDGSHMTVSLVAVVEDKKCNCSIAMKEIGI